MLKRCGLNLPNSLPKMEKQFNKKASSIRFSGLQLSNSNFNKELKSLQSLYNRIHNKKTVRINKTSCSSKKKQNENNLGKRRQVLSKCKTNKEQFNLQVSNLLVKINANVRQNNYEQQQLSKRLNALRS
jgi:hypothetical protein